MILVRNLYKAILSYWNLYITQSHTGIVDQRSFSNTKFKSFVTNGAFMWFELIEDWISFGENIYFLLYEDLQEDPVKVGLIQYNKHKVAHFRN